MNSDHEQPEQPRAAGRDDPLHVASEAAAGVPLSPSGDPDEVRRWALGVMAGFGLTEWRFEFTRGVRVLGVCRYRSRTIGLSVHLVRANNREQLRETLFHECAHALVGPGHGHDAVWGAKCREIGARPERCCTVELDLPEGRWLARCGGCGNEFRRHRRPKRMTGWFCRRCGRHKGTLTWVLSSGS